MKPCLRSLRVATTLGKASKIQFNSALLFSQNLRNYSSQVKSKQPYPEEDNNKKEEDGYSEYEKLFDTEVLKKMGYSNIEEMLLMMEHTQRPPGLDDEGRPLAPPIHQDEGYYGETFYENAEEDGYFNELEEEALGKEWENFTNK